MAIIKSKTAYHEERLRYGKILNEIAEQRRLLAEEGLLANEIERMLQPLRSRCEELRDQLTFFDQIQKGDLSVLENLSEGQVLIAMRLAKGLSQRQLAEMLGVDQSQVSRDEANEYRTATLERFRKVAEMLDSKVQVVPQKATAPRTHTTRPGRSEGAVRFESIPPAAPLGIPVDEAPPLSAEDRVALLQLATGRA